MNRPKVVRVEIEYENGQILRQVGEKAEQIWQHVESSEVMNFIHGFKYDGPFLEEVQIRGANPETERREKEGG